MKQREFTIIKIWLRSFDSKILFCFLSSVLFIFKNSSNWYENLYVLVCIFTVIYFVFLSFLLLNLKRMCNAVSVFEEFPFQKIQTKIYVFWQPKNINFPIYKNDKNKKKLRRRVWEKNNHFLYLKNVQCDTNNYVVHFLVPVNRCKVFFFILLN